MAKPISEQILPHHVGVAAVAVESLAQPILASVEQLAPLSYLKRLHAARVHKSTTEFQ